MSAKTGISLFGSKTREAVLSLFFLNTAKKFYLREIAKRLGASAGTLQRELKNLMRLNLVVAEKSGNRVYYQLNKANPIFRDLESIMKKAGGFVVELRSMLSRMTGIDFAFIYGSYANNTEAASSDIDLFVAGGIPSAELIPKLRPLERKIGREINPFIIGIDELREKMKRNNHFLHTVFFKEKKIMITGNESEIQKILGR